MTKTEALVDVVRIVVICSLLAFGMYSCNSCHRTEAEMMYYKKVEGVK